MDQTMNTDDVAMLNCHRKQPLAWKRFTNVPKLFPQTWRRRKWTTIISLLLCGLLLLQLQLRNDDILQISKGYLNIKLYPAESSITRQVHITAPKANFSHPIFSMFTKEEVKLFEKAWDLQAPWKERTIAQVAMIDIVQRHRVLKEKVIYTMNNKQPEGRKRLISENCPNAPCRFTHNHSERLDAVIYDNDYYYPDHLTKTPDQTWIFIRLENPLNPQPPEEIAENIDWLVTYWTDSLLVSTYNNMAEKYPRHKGLRLTNFTSTSTRDFSKGKTKKVIWFASNCYAMNDRLEYALELGKHIQVDIYGSCGTLDCPRTDENECFEMIRKDYKFYLAFENANCHDYITEKFWRALQYDAIPIVMGAKPEEYERQVPPGSYIHVDDFASAKELADTLHELDADPVLYNKYFAWRKYPSENLEFQQFCRICAMLHSVDWLGKDQRPNQSKTLMTDFFSEKACVPSWKQRKKYQESVPRYEDDYLESKTVVPVKSSALRPAHRRNRSY